MCLYSEFFLLNFLSIKFLNSIKMRFLNSFNYMCTSLFLELMTYYIHVTYINIKLLLFLYLFYLLTKKIKLKKNNNKFSIFKIK